MIKKLPDDVTTGAIMEELFFKQQVENGLQDVAEGRVLTHEELKAKNRSRAQVRWSLTAENDLHAI